MEAQRVAVLFHRIGPYHFARLRAAGRQLAVTAVEFCNVDPTYAWDEVVGEEGFARLTLFPGEPVATQTAGRIFERMGQALGQIKPGAVAIPGWHGRCPLAALRWCAREQVPVVVMSETTAWDEPRRWWKEAVKRRILRLCTAGLVGGTPHAEYLAQLGMSRSRVFTGYDAVDNDYFANGADASRLRAAELRRQHQLPERYFLASARFVPKKNLLRLLDAYARYRELAATPQVPSAGSSPSPPPSPPSPSAPWFLVLLGDGPLRGTLETRISELGIRDSVRLPGFKQYPALPVYYGLAGAFIHASTTEQWGLVINEAMAGGLPVLVSNHCGCAQDLVQVGRNGFTFDPCDVQALAQLLARVSSEGCDRQAMGDASREIISHWGAQAFAENLWQAAQTALEAPPPRQGLLSRALLWALHHCSLAPT